MSQPSSSEPLQTKRTEICLKRAILSQSIFTTTLFLNYTLQSAIVAVLSDIQNYFEINEKQKGLIQMFFMGAFISFLPIFGALGDRINRKWLLIFGVLVSVVSATTGSLARRHQFWLFLLSTAGVGIGSSGYYTVSTSMMGQ